MFFRKILRNVKMFKRIFAGIISLNFIVMMTTYATVSPLIKAVTAAETTQALPTINEVIDASGFKHPGVGITKGILENMRTEVLAQKDPWYTYYNAMLQSSSASKTVKSSNESNADSSKPSATAFNSQGVEAQFIADALKAYTQAVLYYVTGDETYRANSMHIIRIWSQMDPTKYVYYTDAHIHAGIPLNRMVTAAEILRYTSCTTEALKWTNKDTTDFTNNLITPVIETFLHDNNHFMNQHTYPLLGAMAGYIFTSNKARYNEGVEWFTVNKTATDQGQNGSIEQLFRLVDKDAVTGAKVEMPRVQHVEMGRDLAHGSGDITNAEILARLLLAQGTKVDPVSGNVSTAFNAVNPYEFLNDRILKAADYFAQFMLGYDTPWTPTPAHTDVNGNPTIIYKAISGQYRGRLISNIWEIYYYYQYVAGVNMQDKAPYFTKLFSKRLPPVYSYGGNVGQAWDGVDGGGDFWIFIPKAAEAEGAKNIPKVQPDLALKQVEERYTSFDNNAVTKQEGDTSFVEIKATENGSKIATYSASCSDKTIGFKIRTNGAAKLEMLDGINDTLTLPDTKGQWRYVTYTMGVYQNLGDFIYLNIKGVGTIVDIDFINVKAGTQLTPPVFKAGSSALNLFTYAGCQEPITFDFSAADANASDVVTYTVDNKPEGALINESTGIFSWKPTGVGTYNFVVDGSDGTTVTTKEVKIVVSADRKSAINAVIAPYNESTKYLSLTLDNYKKAYDDAMILVDSATDKDFYKGLFNLKTAVEGLKPLTPLLKDGSFDFVNTLVTSSFDTQAINLIDSNPDTFVVYTLAPNLNHIIDFGVNYRVSANAFKLQVRSGFPDRITGTGVFGSNDGETWTRLTAETAVGSEDMQTLQVIDKLKNSQFRFIKLEMIDSKSTMLELSEFRIFGERYEIKNSIDKVSISSPQSFINRIVPGNSVNLTFHAKEVINNVKVSIQGQNATVNTDDNMNWTSEVVLDKNVPTGTVKFNINYKMQDGTNGTETIFTTDSTKLVIVDDSDLIGDVVKTTNFIDPSTSSGRPNAAETLKQVSYLFDSNANTNSDFRLGGNGSGGYITFDFKEGKGVALSKVEILARQDNYYGRIKGTVVQGSNDNSTWTTISKSAAIGTKDWQTLDINGTTAYRYIRIYNASAWYGNMAELRFHAYSPEISGK